MNENQVMHAMNIDDAYRVERVLAQGPAGVTECVTIDGAGPFIRKKLPLASANRGVWMALAGCENPRLPHVAATYEMPDRFVVVYDYIPGDTLERFVGSDGPLGVARACRTIEELCGAVSELHAHGVIHRDVSPQNVIMAADGAHLIDLGNALLATQPAPKEAHPLGTWGFAAPEQFGFAPADARTDVYALGRLLAFMLCGVRPDDDAFEAALADERVVPPRLRAVIDRACAFEPSARFQDCAALARAVAAAGEAAGGADSTSGSGGESASAASRPSAARRFGRGRVIAVAAVLVVLVAGVLVAVGSGVLGRDGGGAGSVSAITDSGSGEPDAALSSGDSGEAQLGALSGAVQTGTSPAASSPAAGDAAGEADADAVAAATQALSVSESYWYVDDGGYLRFGFALTNASDTLAVDLPSVKVTGRDANGAVVCSTEAGIMSIWPGQTRYVSGLIPNAPVPNGITFEVGVGGGSRVRRVRPEDASVYEVKDLAQVSDGFGGTVFTGEVTMTHKGGDVMYGSSEAAVSVVLRDASGALVSVVTAYVTCGAEGQSASFQTLPEDVPEHASLEASVQPW